MPDGCPICGHPLAGDPLFCCGEYHHPENLVESTDQRDARELAVDRADAFDQAELRALHGDDR